MQKLFLSNRCVLNVEQKSNVWSVFNVNSSVWEFERVENTSKIRRSLRFPPAESENSGLDWGNCLESLGENGIDWDGFLWGSVGNFWIGSFRLIFPYTDLAIMGNALVRKIGFSKTMERQFYLHFLGNTLPMLFPNNIHPPLFPINIRDETHRPGVSEPIG